jgi:pimeloyl-ACP methyl ester carboxylesterase
MACIARLAIDPPTTKERAVVGSCTIRLAFTLGLLIVVLAPVHAQPNPPPQQGVVFAVDGAAFLRVIGDDLQQATADAKLPLRVENVTWSHGRGRILADLHGHEHQKSKGEALALAILAQRKQAPTGKVFIVCHSAGAAVVIAAAQRLPPGSVDRIILLAPALSPSCDLRDLLVCSRQGVDSFHSGGDLGCGLLTVFGTADGQFHVPAACIGFTVPTDIGEDERLYANLRQHAWEKDMAKTGHHGGHFGCTRTGFLRAYVVPLLADSTVSGRLDTTPPAERPVGYRRP